jgi:hypothetical protein
MGHGGPLAAFLRTAKGLVEKDPPLDAATLADLTQG